MITCTEALVQTSCGACNIQFAVPESWDKRRRDNGHDFWCPNGCKISYGDTTTDRLRKQLSRERADHDQTRASRDQARRDSDHQERRASTFKGHLTRTKNRIANGVCPCCNRNFKNLHRHMQCKHPDYQVDPAAKD